MYKIPVTNRSPTPPSPGEKDTPKTQANIPPTSFENTAPLQKGAHYPPAAKRHTASVLFPKSPFKNLYQDIVDAEAAHKTAVQSYIEIYSGKPDELAAKLKQLIETSEFVNYRAMLDAITQIRNTSRDQLVKKHTGDAQLETLYRGLNACGYTQV